MTRCSPAYPSRRRALVDRRFVRHYLEMLGAMIVGMAVLGPLSMLLGDVAVELDALLMATYMTTGMTAWMVYRRHGRPAIAEMALVMFAAFVVLFPPLWAEWITADTLFVAGHVLMLPAMALAMLRRREEYLAPHGAPPERRPGHHAAASGSGTGTSGPGVAFRAPDVDRGSDDAESLPNVIARKRS